MRKVRQRAPLPRTRTAEHAGARTWSFGRKQPLVALQLALPVHPLAQDDVVKHLCIPCVGDIVTLGAGSLLR